MFYQGTKFETNKDIWKDILTLKALENKTKIGWENTIVIF